MISEGLTDYEREAYQARKLRRRGREARRRARERRQKRRAAIVLLALLVVLAVSVTAKMLTTGAQAAAWLECVTINEE